jgi:NIPSNAP protein
MKTSLSFLCGAAVMLPFSALSGSNPSHHVYELRLYHVHEGKMDALKARFGDHTDAIFKRHTMKSIGYWSPEDAPDSQNLFVYILEHASREDAEKNWAAFQADPEWEKVKAPVGGARTAGRSHRSLLHGSDELFSPALGASRTGREMEIKRSDLQRVAG